jgi:hypothetical protein
MTRVKRVARRKAIAAIKPIVKAIKSKKKMAERKLKKKTAPKTEKPEPKPVVKKAVKKPVVKKKE